LLLAIHPGRGYIPSIARTRRPTRKDSPEASGRIRTPSGRRIGFALILLPNQPEFPGQPQGWGQRSRHARMDSGIAA
jgi:hypothetical protein